MKRRLFLIIMFAAITLSGMAQNIGEAFYIYRNDGQFNAFFRDEVLSIEYSYEDADGNTYDEIVTQIVNTADSVYKIPLAAIDSVGFVTPEPIYKENVRELSGDLLAYVISVDSLTIKLKGDIPENLLPLVNDKIVQLWYSDLCPNGFLGKVANINKDEDSYTLTCNYINIEDAVSRYYATYRLTTDNYSSQGIARRAGKVSSLELFHKIYEQENIPLYTSLEFLTNHLWKSKDEIAGVQLGGKGDMSFNIQPKFDIKVTFSMDDFLGIIPKYNLHASTTYNLTTDVQAVGEVQFEHKDGKMSLFPKLKPEIPLLGPIMFYWDFGLVATGSIEIGAGFSSTKSGWQIIDADYYPIYSTVLPPISFLKGRGGMSTNDLTWNYLVGNAEVKLGAYIEAGFSLFNSKVFKVGGDLSIGAKANAACEFNPVFWKQSEVTTDCYDNSRDNCKIGVTPFVGGNFYVSAADDRAKWTILGGDFDIPGISVESYLLPSFKNVILQQKEESRSSFHAKAEVEGGCIFPVQLGFALFGSDNKHIKTVLYEEKKYWKDNSFSSFEVDFIDIPLQDIYTIYPVVKLFNKNMLASPLSFIKNNGSATIQDFEQTNAQYSKAAFTNEDKKYDFCYNAAITVAIDDMTNVDDWGYVYEDPDGKIAHVSLKTHESPYTDTNYAFYRNEPTSTACLYSYVKYQGDEKYYYGEKTEYPLAYDKQPKATTLGVVEVGTTTAMVKCGYKEVAPWGGICGVEYWKDSNHQELLFETANVEIDVLLDNLTPETPYNYRAFIKVGEAYIWAEETKSFKTSEAQVQLCPDDHHPHMIDLGLPSGTKWACCNVGASKPEDYGGFYDIGEAFEKDEYSWENYPYRDVNLGEDIAGTSYDVAYVLWGKGWNTPSLTQFKEMVDHTTFKAVTQNGVFGGLFTSETGQSIFLPAVGYKLAIIYDQEGNIIKEYYHAGEKGAYWTSSQWAHREGDTDSMYEMFFSRENNVIQPPTFDAANNFWGLPLRAVQPGIVVETGDATEVTETSATLNGSVENYDETNSKISFVFLLSTSEDIINSSDKRTIEATYSSNGIISATVTDLSDNSKYYYMLAAIIDGEYQYACNKNEFRTSAVIKIEMKATTNISYTSATIGAVCSIPEYSGILKYKKEGDNNYVECWIEGYTNGEMQCTIDHLEIDAKYYCCASIFIGGETIESDTISFRTNNICPNDNHPHLIDLGLGLKWSCCNVEASKPEDAGGYYSWGETAEKQDYSIDNYIYRGKNEIGSDVFVTIGPDISKSEYDVAYKKMGNQYRMPTKEEMDKLCQYSPSYWASKNGVEGHLFVGDNGNAIFFQL